MGVLDIRQLLALAPVFEGFNELIGARASRRYVLQHYIQAREGDRILDLGCGTAEILDLLPPGRYVGIDPDDTYVTQAGKRARGNDLLIKGNPLEDAVIPKEPFDIVLAMGVLHHLPDPAALKLLERAFTALQPGGRFISMDPAFEEGQSPVARLLARMDRGENVRSAKNYAALVATFFKYIQSHTHHNLLRFPYTHTIVIAKR